MADSPKERTEIVNLDQIMTDQQIKEERWTFTALSEAINTKENCLIWLAKRRLIKNSCKCINCHQPASFISHEQGIDGFRWLCLDCNIRKSVRDNSFFGGSHISLLQLIQLIYCWSYDMPLDNIIHETKIYKETVIAYCNFCREECEKYINRHGLLEIGGIGDNGEPIIVEINEPKQFKRKYLTCESCWVFGGKERHSRKGFLVEIPDNTKASLTEAITKHILPGTHIESRSIAAFANIAKIHSGIYSHSVVKQQVHTTNVEKLWMRAKRLLRRQFGSSTIQFSTSVNEFLFRNSIGDGHIFGAVLIAIAEDYVV
uniref:ISXO2-like transposase domain-containing protein n=1 Tax=Biomphalaria glabrata TaxID=6526 RepID=A0A2C9K113_BIOGL